MSAQKWESVTWDWIEREIADCLLIANRGLQNSESFANLLAKRLETASVPSKCAARQGRSANNG